MENGAGRDKVPPVHTTPVHKGRVYPLSALQTFFSMEQLVVFFQLCFLNYYRNIDHYCQTTLVLFQCTID